ncbi:Six-hairpin glycosidase [Rhizodiscina lignyota]|uniref:Six-hairpin glycosidase n=1 Tax=Rhizodiscina lignyota TaxID=1504668 RepID=A0A9P4IAX5_9PEZI|nr:Six-hairpin glycosidase [Rhizodiscina lignyota]
MFLLVFIAFIFGLAYSQDPSRPYPLPDSYLKSTNILEHATYVKSFDDPQWYLDNIPFVDFPDQHIQDVYYYRATVIKRHIKWGHEGHGWLFTEFIHPVSWASKLQTIPDSVGHHLVEGRWLRNPNYIKDLILLYTRGGVEVLSGITYTHYLHDAILEHAQATGDVDFLISQLDGMVRTFNLWDVQFNDSIGLYHRTPLSDAQEFSLPGYIVGGVDGKPVNVWNDTRNNFDLIWLGPETYRPNFNAYMVAGARAISQVATLAGNSSLSEQWSARAAAIEERMNSFLWEDSIKWWIDVVEGSNIRAVGRQMIGYFPYRFDVGTNETIVKGLEAGLTSEEFLTEFGPTTLEMTNPYYTALKNLTYCCVWQGQSWPFSTSVFLDTLAILAREDRSTIATKEFFNEALLTYARTNYKDGIPYTAESHYPTIDMWSGDSTNHSEHYLHSTYFNNIFTDLIGILPTLDDRFQMHPLVPDNWTHFAIESLPYHGTLLSILPRARQFSSVSLAIFDDTARDGVIKCPSSVRITTNNHTMLAERNHWDACVPNALNTIVFNAAGTIVETDNLQITVFNELMYAVAISEIQIWVPANTGPRYEAEDGLLGTFIGGFEGRGTGLNCTIDSGGVTIHEGGWAELAGVKSTVGTGSGALTVIGKGSGSVVVQMNWLEKNATVAFDGVGVQQKEIQVDYLEGENYVTLFWESGEPWIDAIVVGTAAANSTMSYQ